MAPLLRRFILAGSILILASCGHTTVHDLGEVNQKSLAEAYADQFLIGAAVTPIHFDSGAVENVLGHFNAVVAENLMKPAYLQPQEGEFFWEEADRFVAFGEAHGMHITGHTLAWHIQYPDWLFSDAQGNDVSREVLLQRMDSHISTVMQRYRGRIHSWDVVNEAFLNSGEMRPSKFYEIIGPDWVEQMFRIAAKADPEAKLYYNDFSLFIPAKRDAVYAYMKALQEKGVRVDGIGMQQHLLLDSPSLEEIEPSLVLFSELGDVLITELDVSVLPFPMDQINANVSANFELKHELNPYENGLPADIAAQFNQRYLGLFELYERHSDKITRVTTWGISDADSWKNNWPVHGRTDYPLLFDRAGQPKPIVTQLLANNEKD